MDLGVARLQDESVRLSQTGAFVGSLEYAVPEQFRRRTSPADGELRPPRPGPAPLRAVDGPPSVPGRGPRGGHASRPGGGRRRRPESLNPQLSPFFEEVLDTLLPKDPAARFASAAELVHVLERGRGLDLVDGERSTCSGRPRTVRCAGSASRARRAFYGRGEELGAAPARLRRGRGRATGASLLIEGEAGIGKTRLVDEFVARLRAEGEDLNFLFGSYPPAARPPRRARSRPPTGSTSGSRGCEETLASYLTETPVLVPAFAALLRGESVPTGQESLTQDVAADRLRARDPGARATSVRRSC